MSSYTHLDENGNLDRNHTDDGSMMMEDEEYGLRLSSSKMSEDLSEPLTTATAATSAAEEPLSSSAGQSSSHHGNGWRNGSKNGSSSMKDGDTMTKKPKNGSYSTAAVHAEDDPFHVFRADLYHKMELVDESLAEFLRIVHQTDTAVNTHELKESKKILKRHLKNAEATLKDVHTTVQVVENDRSKFNHIDDTELYSRRSLVNTSRDRLSRAKQEMHSEAVKAKMLADERAKALRRTTKDGGYLGATTHQQRENTDMIVDSQAKTSLLMQHQDETLDELDAAVTRVGHMADNIHDEIGQQNKMLTDLESDLDNVEEELGVVMGKLGKFLQTKDRFQLGTIVALTITVVVLFIIVVYF